jgi:hypothetical protein
MTTPDRLLAKDWQDRIDFDAKATPSTSPTAPSTSPTAPMQR